MKTLIILLLTTTVAWANNPLPRNPPARWDHPYRGILIVVPGSAARIAKECGSPYLWACTFGNIKGRCKVFISKVGVVAEGEGAVDREGYANLLRHEIGHCNGWPGGHPH
jgi:hypothetical protein